MKSKGIGDYSSYSSKKLKVRAVLVLYVHIMYLVLYCTPAKVSTLTVKMLMLNKGLQRDAVVIRVSILNFGGCHRNSSLQLTKPVFIGTS